MYLSLEDRLERREFADELAAIGSALSESADILIYGCNFAEGDIGRVAADTRLSNRTE